MTDEFRLWKTLVVAAILAVLATAASYFYQSAPQFISFTRVKFYRGLPFPYYTTTVADIIGPSYQFSPFSAVVDFLIFLILAMGVLLALARISNRFTRTETAGGITRQSDRTVPATPNF